MQPQPMPRLALVLAVAGTVPFIALSAAVALSPETYQPLALTALFTYAAVILSFLGGIHWGMSVYHTQEQRADVARPLYLIGIAATLMAWGILFLPEDYLKLLAFAFLYAVAWGIDSVLHSNKLIPLWYLNLRGIVTPIVVVSMYVAYFSVI